MTSSLKHVGHRWAEVFQVLAYHDDANSGSFLDSCVKSAILGSWQDMEVLIFVRIVTRVLTIIVMIISISIQLQLKVAILDLCILLLVSRALTLPCNVINCSPSFVVRIKIVTEVQFEFSIWVVPIDLDVINISVIWHLWIIESFTCFIFECKNSHGEILLPIEAIDTFFTSNFNAINFVGKILRSPFNLVFMILVVQSKFIIWLPFFSK